jgi:hypothetical protein
MCKKLMLLGCLVALLGLSNTAFAWEELIFKADFSCPNDPCSIKGGEWFDFWLFGYCDANDPKKDLSWHYDVCDTRIDVGAGRDAGGGNLSVRAGDHISNSTLHPVGDEFQIYCGDMDLKFAHLDPTTSYRVYTYHAWDVDDDEITSISIHGDDGNDIKNMPDVVDTIDDSVLLAHEDVGKIDFTTGEDTGDGNAPVVWIKFKGCARFNAFALYYTDPKAQNPNPIKTERDVCPNDLQLSWAPAEGLVDRSHDVYFGTDYVSVRDANTIVDPNNVYKGRQDSNEYPEDGNLLLDLELETTYYWRVDTVNEGNVIPGGGYTWSFTTEDGNARYPSPYDYEVAWHPDANVLTWTPACVALSQEVYLSTSFSNVDGLDGAAYLGTLAAGANTIGTPALDTQTTYYWRVKSNGGGINGDGHIWRFATGYGGLVMYYKFNGTVGNDLPGTITDDSGNNIQFTKHTAGNGSVKYAQSNPVVLGSSSSAEFNPDPNSGFYRLDTGFNDPLLLGGTQYTIEA